MDTRVALSKGYKLKLRHTENGICTYTIQGELARGGASIVYNASYQNNSGTQKAVRIKECYPFSLNIFRKDDGGLFPESGSEAAFEESKKRMWQSFDIGNELFRTEGLTNYTSNTMDIYQQNGTVYIVTVYQEGEVLSCEGFSSLKDCVAVTKSIAGVLEKIHNKGYLYLDMKPDNVFTLNGTTDIVQLFDFDSLIPISAFEDEYNQNYKISYTRGFSALELQTGNWKRIGKHSDVYSVGAILFYLMFGRAPEATDSEPDAKYDFGKMKYSGESFQDELYERLTVFFHNTLANYYLDRYSDMYQVIRELEQIEHLANTTIPFIQSVYLPSPKLLVGRNAEIHALEKWLAGPLPGVFFVVGMGGIGKSSLVRYYMNVHAQDFDTVVFLDYYRSLEQTIADDRQFVIHTVQKSKQEKTEEYFIRKLAVARSLTKGKRVVVVIDNYTDDESAEKNRLGILELLRTDWKIILITRCAQSANSYDVLEVNGIQKTEDVCKIFECYLRRPLLETECTFVEKISNKVQGHTLVLELIARQIANSFLTVSQAANLIEENGFSEMALEQVTYNGDFMPVTGSVRNIISNLFDVSRITAQQKSILKNIAFLGTAGVDANVFAALYGLDSKDVLHALSAEGWIILENYRIFMHPVLMEIVNGWEMTDAFRKSAAHMMTEIRRKLEQEQKDESSTKQAENTNGSKIIENGIKHNGEDYLRMGEMFLDGCSRDEQLYEYREYKELLFVVVYRMPREREIYILEHTMELLSNPGGLNADIIMKLYGLMVEIYEEHGELDKVYEILMQAKQFVKDSTKRTRPRDVWMISRKDSRLKNEESKHCEMTYLMAQYEYLWVWYYDARLDGNYEALTGDDRKILARLLKILDRAIRYMGKSKNPEAEERLAEYSRCKATVLIRSGMGKKSNVKKLLDKTETLLAGMKQKNYELKGSYYLTCAWYYTYMEPDFAMVMRNVNKADEVSGKWCNNELDYIDSVLVPAANIYMESGESEQAAAFLQTGIELCQKQEQIIPYKKKEEQLRKYMEDVQGK